VPPRRCALLLSAVSFSKVDTCSTAPMACNGDIFGGKRAVNRHTLELMVLKAVNAG